MPPKNANSIPWANTDARARLGRALDWRYFEDEGDHVVRIIAKLEEGPWLAFDGGMFFVGVVCQHGQFCVRTSMHDDDLAGVLAEEGMARPPDEADCAIWHGGKE